ncbi:MAG: xylulokinase [Clostridia bacterium]|nr:xylulokinase [Clostridia bacterium]
MAVYLGIDLGTTGLKSLLVREDGAICGSGYREYPISIPVSGYAEQNPEDWWLALRDSLAKAMRRAEIDNTEIAGIGLSGQMHGTVLTDERGVPLRPAIIWCDQRSADQVAAIREQIGLQRLGEWTQNPVGVGFQICSLLWVRENQPEIYRKTRHALLPKDYIRFRLTGEYGTEPSDACSTLMFNCAKQTWSEEMLSAFHIDPALLPDANHSAAEIHAPLTREAAEILGLRPGIPVVFGGGDQPMQAVGNGILRPGDASITLGTGGQIFVPVDTPAYDPQLRTHTFCHAQRDSWYVMGAILNCCLAQNWFFDKVLHTHAFAERHEAAAQIAPGCGGLYFLPYLTGERTPHLNPKAKGMFFGLTLEHDSAAMTRAVLEGVGYALADAMECIRALNPRIHRLIVSGGGARSPLWRQILADMLEQPIYATTMTEEAGIGAAICAMVGAGAYESLEQACGAIVRCEDGCTEPIPANAEIYREGQNTFRALYKVNHSLFQG